MGNATPVAPMLREVLANRDWTRRTRPFSFVVARNVFTDRVHAALAEAFRALFAAPDNGPSGLPPGCTRYRSEHVQGGIDFGPVVPQPFEIFFSRAWHDMLATICGVRATGHMSGGLHHHEAGSATGRVHHDLNPGWFDGSPRMARNSLILWLHRPKAEALARWGASPVVPWRH